MFDATIGAAEEVRVHADEMHDEAARQAMLAIGEAYEKLADRAEATQAREGVSGRADLERHFVEQSRSMSRFRALFPKHSFDRAKRLLGGVLAHLATRD
jgi:hypothetical protein